jgi:hypothetical protein
MKIILILGCVLVWEGHRAWEAYLASWAAVEMAKAETSRSLQETERFYILAGALGRVGSATGGASYK